MVGSKKYTCKWQKQFVCTVVDRKKHNSKNGGHVASSIHSQMGLGKGALGIPELRRIPSGYPLWIIGATSAKIEIKGSNGVYCQLGLRGDWSLNESE